MDLKIKNKVFLVAASSSGLGFGIAQELAQNGAITCIASRTKEDIEKAADKIRSENNSEIYASTFDASISSSITKWVNDVYKKYGRIDGLLVNAGGPPKGMFEELSDEDWLKGFELTLMSAVRLIREVLEPMKKSGGGSILTVTSTAVKEPIDVLLLSNVFRSGVTSLVKSLSKDLGKYNIRVNNLIPGRINTERLKGLDTIIAQKEGISLQEAQAATQAQIALGRYGTIEEFGKAGAFLLSDAASYITGSSLVIDGGLTKTIW